MMNVSNLENMSNHKKTSNNETIEDNERPEWDWIRKNRS